MPLSMCRSARTEGLFFGDGSEPNGGMAMKKTGTKGSAAKILRKELQLHLMVLPAVILVLVFS